METGYLGAMLDFSLKLWHDNCFEKSTFMNLIESSLKMRSSHHFLWSVV